MAKEIHRDGLILQYGFDVTTADCDPEGRLRPGGLSNFLVLSAINSAETLGFGYNELRRYHLFWVLSRMTIRIHKPLKWRDQAVVETWPKDIRGLLYLRDFKVKNQADELCTTCTSGWLAIDIYSKRPKKVEDKFGYLFDKLKDRHAMEEFPEKLEPLTEGELSERQVTWFDLDVNRHVTSTRYIDWMVDTLPADFLTSHYPTLLSINYLKETMMGESVTLLRSTTDSNQFFFQGAGKDTATAKFRGRLVF